MITAAKVVTIFEHPNNSLLFIENLCFCSLKIAVCVPKITIISKNCRLKITIISKNYRLKIPVRACVRVYACMTEENRTHDHDQHTTGTHDHRKREERRQHGKTCIYMYDFMRWKKYKKSLKKFGNMKKPPYLCAVIKQQTSLIIKLQSNENN